MGSLMRHLRHPGHAILSVVLVSGCDLSQFNLAPVDPSAIARPVVADDPCTPPEQEVALETRLIRAVNAERKKVGAPPLKSDPTLTAIADFWGCRMIDGGFFGHVDPANDSTVAERAADFGYPFLKIGENLAAGQPSAEEVVAEWMKSPKHRENMLDPAFVEIGVAVKDGGQYGRYWVQELGRALSLDDMEAAFASPDDEPPPPAASTRPSPSQS